MKRTAYYLYKKYIKIMSSFKDYNNFHVYVREVSTVFTHIETCIHILFITCNTAVLLLFSKYNFCSDFHKHLFRNHKKLSYSFERKKSEHKNEFSFTITTVQGIKFHT